MWDELLTPHDAATSRLGLGSLPFSGFYGPCETATAVELIHRALDAGIALLDVTDPSPDGRGLRAVREALATRRDSVFLAVHGRAPREGTAEEIQAVEALLRDLDTDRLDLYYLPRSAGGAPLEDRVGALGAMVAAGKVRHLGVHGAGAEEIARAHISHPIAALAVEYSLTARGAERDRLPVARRLGLTVVACRPLAGGVLTGRPTRRSPQEARLHEGLRDAAAALDIGIGRLALAWLLAQGEDIVPVPGTSDKVHLEMNLRSERVRMPAEVCARLQLLTEEPEPEP